jgi:hypothetical protein
MVAMVKSAISTSGNSSQVTGADTGPHGRPRTEYAAAMVRSLAFGCSRAETDGNQFIISSSAASC